ncbi:DUF3307 domain-containing protein [Streptomyces lonarensis]|uniref:DUF3307 domain-containing protein n=1 Tax=Streptomyces lonarensis TaxID=700599 RepID=A0A7X6HXE6_9ACTN|nr:DUF3307 domain-containing protein [Streptomyces lonarensis]NJQ04275.1 DUF3307 domain-containing protein [Streptomyces lonarensis]
MFAELFILLYAAHIAADYPLQTDHQAKHKAGGGRCGWTASAAHAGTHLVAMAAAVALGALLLDWDLPLLPAGFALVAVAAAHALIDRRWPVQAWMRIARQEKWAQHGGAAHVDQAAHVLTLVAAALAIAA